MLCKIFSPSGNEAGMKHFLIDYVKEHQHSWKVQPEIVGDELQDCLILRFGKPRTAILAHMDTVGFTVRYQNQLLPIGGPQVKDGYKLVGSDSLGPIFLRTVCCQEEETAPTNLQICTGY